MLWIVAALLAAAFLVAGARKLIQPKEKLAASGLGWTEDVSNSAVKGIGALEVLGAIGLVLPAMLNIAPILVPLAATGPVIVMIGAGITHARRGERSSITVNVVLGGLALFVAIARFGPYAS